MSTTTETRERPIIFSGPMVRAILDDRKTQTRRVVKPQHVDGMEIDDDGNFCFMHHPTCGGYCDYACAAEGEVLDGHIGWTPWGSHPEQWGRLWVRETWSEIPQMKPSGYFTDPKWINRRAWYAADNDKPMWGGRWVSPIHMPRRFSRIMLEIVEVRVQRLQEISEEDAIAEGAQCAGFPASLTNRGAFGKLWDKLNAKRGYGWESNPWVWAITFKRV